MESVRLYFLGSKIIADGDCTHDQNSGFMQPKDSFLGNTESEVEGIFYAGAVTAPKNVAEALNDGSAAALKVAEWLKK